MARYVVSVRSPKSPEESFAYMADLTNFAQWDPGVVEVTQVDGDGAGPDSSFDVTVKGVAGNLTLRYVTTAYDEPSSLTAVAKSSMLKSVDIITVAPDQAGSVVTYDAELTLNGLLGLADIALRPVFNRIGDKAAEGLIAALDGERVGV
ncbi:MAG: SRPBCC family protein [Actinomycetota bacterium]